jgi:hypothetical protein
VRGVLNRLLGAPLDLVNRAQPADRDYALQELSSFYLSWLQALPGVVVNRPAPQGFCGRWRHTSEWAVLAQKAGLPAPAYRQSASDDPAQGFRALAPAGAPLETAIVLFDKVFGPSLPDETVAACRRFAALAEVEMLGISLFQAGGRVWKFASATPYPDLSAGGQPLLSHLASVLKKGELQ